MFSTNLSLSDSSQFTVFGPTNDAFAALSPEMRDALTNNVTLLTNVLKYHVVGAKVYSSSLRNEQQADSLEGEKIRINVYNKPEGTVS